MEDSIYMIIMALGIFMCSYRLASIIPEIPKEEATQLVLIDRECYSWMDKSTEEELE